MHVRIVFDLDCAKRVMVLSPGILTGIMISAPGNQRGRKKLTTLLNASSESPEWVYFADPADIQLANIDGLQELCCGIGTRIVWKVNLARYACRWHGN